MEFAIVASAGSASTRVLPYSGLLAKQLLISCASASSATIAASELARENPDSNAALPADGGQRQTASPTDPRPAARPLSKEEYTHVIALVPGIRDTGGWHNRVSVELQAPGTHVAQIHFRFHSAVRFLCPLNLSNGPTQIVKTELANLRHEYPNAKLSVIAHSFGTYLVQRALREDPHLKLWKLVFCGSVADDLTNWAVFEGRVGVGSDNRNRPKKDFIVNDCGSGDPWPVLGTAFGWYYGMAGVLGFNEAYVTNRFHRGNEDTPGGHSLYFQNNFVRKYWRPFLIDDLPPVRGNGAQGEHLPWYIKVFYYGLCQWFARLFALIFIWLGIPVCIVWLALHFTTIGNNRENPSDPPLTSGGDEPKVIAKPQMPIPRPDAPPEIEGPKHKAWAFRTQIMNRTYTGGIATGHGPSEHVSQMGNLDLGEHIVAVEAWPGRGCDTFSFVVRTVDGRLENRPPGVGFGGHKGGSLQQHVDVPPGDFIVQYSCEHGELTDAWTFWTNGGKQLRVGGRGHPRSTLPIGLDHLQSLSTTDDGQPLKYELIGGKVTFGKTVDTFQGIFRPYFTAEQLREPDKSE
jgi:hypothetical protein